MNHPNMAYRISKDFGEFPFAHRQPKHHGHCAKIHGHNWRLIVTLGASKLDENGFVFDFGQFKELKDLFTEVFDHTLLLQADDPLLEHLQGSLVDSADIVLMPSVSCEGIAQYVYGQVVYFLLKNGHADRVTVLSVTVTEDAKNSATYSTEGVNIG